MAQSSITLNPGSGGASVSTDLIGTVHWPYTKLADGTLDSTQAIRGDSTNGLDVDVTRLPADRSVTGSLASLNASLELLLDGGDAACGVQITGTWTGTIAFQGRVNASTWQTIFVWDVAARQLVTQTTANGLWAVAVGHLDAIRVTATAWTSGTATVTLLATRGAPGLPAEIQPVSGTVTATQGGTWTVETELPAAGALGDAAANPTTPTVGAAALVFNGSTWDRARGDTANGLDVDVTRVQGNVTVVQPTAANLNATVTGTVNAAQSGAWNVTADTELPAAAALADGAANPTTPTAGSATLLFNGTTWDRARGDITNGLDVDVTRVQGNVTVVQPTAANLNATVTGTVTANQGGTWTVIDGGANRTLRRAVVSLTATGTVIAAVAGRRLKVYQYAIQSRNDSMTVRFRDGSAGGNLGLDWLLNAREGVSSGPINPPSFLFGTSAGNSLDAVLSGTGTVWIEVSYWDDDAT